MAIVYNEDGSIKEIIICDTEANDNWLRALRLMKNKDKKSKKELKRMENQKMVRSED